MSIRENYAEGRFYANTAGDIISLLDENLAAESGSINYSLKNRNILGGVVPHAAHFYCAREAIHFFEIVKTGARSYDTIVIINPNHSGYGDAVSIDSHRYWASPLGRAEVDEEFARLLNLPMNDIAQRYEHSAEVILPYIQHFLGGSFRFLPINMLNQSCSQAFDLAARIKFVADLLQRSLLLIASSDFTHFKSAAEGYELDSYALEALMAFDLKEFERRIKEKRISICGYGAIMTLLQYSLLVDDHAKVEVLKRGHSGEVYPSKEVVDYISLLVCSG